MEAERKNYDALIHLQKSVKYNVDNPVQRSSSFMLLGDISYNKPGLYSRKKFL